MGILAIIALTSKDFPSSNFIGILYGFILSKFLFHSKSILFSFTFSISKGNSFFSLITSWILKYLLTQYLVISINSSKYNSSKISFLSKSTVFKYFNIILSSKPNFLQHTFLVYPNICCFWINSLLSKSSYKLLFFMYIPPNLGLLYQISFIISMITIFS